MKNTTKVSHITTAYLLAGLISRALRLKADDKENLYQNFLKMSTKQLQKEAKACLDY